MNGLERVLQHFRFGLSSVRIPSGVDGFLNIVFASASCQNEGE